MDDRPFNDLFLPKSSIKKKRKINDVNNVEEKSYKKRKISNSESSSDDDHCKILISQSKVTKFEPPNNFSWYDPSDSSVKIENDTDFKLPNSMKHESNKILISREFHNSDILDPTNQKWGTLKSNEFNNKTHILEIIPSGFQDVLTTGTTLRLAINGLGTDDLIIKEENEKKLITLQSSSSGVKKKGKSKDNNVINKIEILGKEGVSINYTFGRLSKQMIKGTTNHFNQLTKDLKSKFYENDEFPINKEINCDLHKSELFKNLTNAYQQQYKNSSKKNEEIASLELKSDLPQITRFYIQTYRYPPRGVEYGERECISGNSCLFNNFKSFASNQYLHYIGREFLLPKDEDIYNTTKKLPEIIGPCIDCLLNEWTQQVNKIMQFNIPPENRINTFKVKVQENEYSSSACLPIKLRNNLSTGIHGFVPAYNAHLRTYSKEKRMDGHVEKEFQYLAEVNVDFRQSLVKQTIV